MSNVLRMIKENVFVILFFSMFFMVGISIYQDYGISWDEPIQREIGYINNDYITGVDRDLLKMKDRFYGPIFEVSLIWVEKVINPTTLRDVFFIRHLFTFASFFVGTIFFYFLAKNLFTQSSTALLSTMALVLSPRIFDNAFYNSKDIPLLVFFIICFTLLFQYMDTKRVSLLIWIALSAAVTVTVRIAGIIIPGLTIIAILVESMRFPGNLWQKIISSIPKLSLFVLLFAFFTVLFWPILWSNPIYHFYQAVKEVSHFNWNNTVLFLGTRYHGSEIPSIYPIVWILISTPFFYSILFFTGITHVIIDNKNPMKWFREPRQMKLFFIATWFFLPLLIVIILKSVLYDSWRHLFFIYPAFILLAFWGLERSFFHLNKKFGRSILPAVIGYSLLMLTFCSTALFMIKAHPYQQLYFNFLSGKNLSEVKSNFDTDYWGLSYRSGLEYISRHDNNPVIHYVAETRPGSYTFILPEADQKRLVYTHNMDEADYLITNYRFVDSYPSYLEVYSVQVDGAKILSVFKLK